MGVQEAATTESTAVVEYFWQQTSGEQAKKNGLILAVLCLDFSAFHTDPLVSQYIGFHVN